MNKQKRALLLMAIDVLVINLTSVLALTLRFDFKFNNITPHFLDRFIVYMPINIICTVFIFAGFHLYSSLWAFAGANELWNIFMACFIATGAEFLGMTALSLRMPYSYYPITFMVLLIITMCVRFSYRLLRRWKREYKLRKESTVRQNVMIIGAGDAGKVIIDEIQKSKHLDYHVRCIVDDDASKHGRYVNGVPIVGGREAIAEKAEEYNIDIIMLAVPSLTPKDRKEILDICQNTGCDMRILPGVYQLINDDVSISKLRKVEISDLLGRDQVKVDVDTIIGYVKDKVVLVTGGGGSIGSELCRQIAAHEPRQLIIFDIYENNAYDIQQELVRRYPELNLTVLIGSVRNTHRIQQVFAQYKPDIVYHAAAHKHVPLMENSPNEAIKNNVFGTWKTARAAMEHGTSKFVLISTDKAVNPTNIMGASKRLCEMIVQMFDKESKTEFVAVRFGNVLGSNGSVIPLFRKQIEEGGPVTVTHPDIIRYFMTIPEAVALVLQAGAYAKGGEIFVLDMGDPVKIDDLARKMIQLSGYTPDVDIEVKYTGLRPGEKLYEEMLMEEEGLTGTENELIHIGRPLRFDIGQFKQQLDELKFACEKDDKAIKQAVARIVTTYRVDGDLIPEAAATEVEEEDTYSVAHAGQVS